MIVLALLLLISTNCFCITLHDRNDFVEFVNSFFGVYNIADTDNFLKCFNDDDTNMFFDWLPKVLNASETMIGGDYNKFHLAYMDLIGINHLVERTLRCGSHTPEFIKLLEAMKWPITYENHFKRMAHDIYMIFMGDPWKIIELLKDPVDLIFDKNDFVKAGEVLGQNFPDLISRIGEELNGISAWMNGIFLGSGLQGPCEIRKILLTIGKDNEVKFLERSFKNWGHLVGGVTEKSALRMTFKYLDGPFLIFYNLINRENWNKVFNSDDMMELKKKYGFTLDPLDRDFLQCLVKYVKKTKNPMLVEFFNNLVIQWDLCKHLENGAQFAHLLQKISDAKDDESLFSTFLKDIYNE